MKEISAKLIDANSVLMVISLIFCCFLYKKIPKEERLLFFFLMVWTFFDLLSLFPKKNNYWTITLTGSLELITLGIYFYRRGQAKWIPYLIASVVFLAMIELSLLLIYYKVYIASFAKALCVFSLLIIIFHQLYNNVLSKQKLILYYAMMLYFSVAFLLFFISFYIIYIDTTLIFLFYIIHVICIAILVVVLTLYLWKSTRMRIA